MVGGGPAGSTAARHLALGGARTLLLERARHPRYKPCGGGLPLHTLHALDVPIDDLIESHVSTVEVSYLGAQGFRKRDGRPFAVMVMRDRLDERLLTAAADAGAIVHQDEAVQYFDPAAPGRAAVVTTAQGRYQAPTVVAADGATGMLARAAGLSTNRARSAAWELEIEAPAAALERWSGVANVDVGYRPWGYGWVFPKTGRLSVGVVLSPGRGRLIRQWTNDYIRRLGLAGAPVHIARGHPLRYRRGGEPVARGALLLSGDAAGLADEFTAEGIHYAVRSGLLAAEATLAALAGEGNAAARYTGSVNRHVQPELDAARAISRMYYWCIATWPRLALGVSARVDYFWRAFFRVMRGESTYAGELRRVPGLALSARIL